MTELVEGGCLCGAVRFRFREEPLATRACWCRVCQYMATGNASVSAFFRTETFEVTGPTSSHVSNAESGTAIRRRFCPTCGTPLFADALGQSDVMVVRVGALDDRAIEKPQSYIWTASAPHWGYIDPDVSICLGQPAG